MQYQIAVLTQLIETHHLDVYCCVGLLDRRVWLVDTPGFDDTFRSDVEVLQEIATFFAELYGKNIKFSSILYLHRITDPRMSGTAVKNLELLRSICGIRALSLITLVTTRWNTLKSELELHEAREREKQLAEEDSFFKPLIERGSRLVRQQNLDASSTRALIRSLVNPEKKIDLDIQFEMVVQCRRLDKTTAGKLLRRDQDEQMKQSERELKELKASIKEALEERDSEALRLLDADRKEFLAKQTKILREQEEMQVDFRQLRERDLREMRAQASTTAIARDPLPTNTNSMAGRYDTQQFPPPPRREHPELRHSQPHGVNTCEFRYSRVSNQNGSVRQAEYHILQRGTLRGLPQGSQRNKVMSFLLNFVT